MARIGVGERQAHALHRLLTEGLRGELAEVLHGSTVLEVRPRGVHKGLVVRYIRHLLSDTTQIVAIGDDRTGEDMCGAMPEGIMIRVGSSKRPA